MITIRFFAAIRELTHTETLTVLDQTHFKTIQDLFDWLKDTYPELQQQPQTCFAINHQFATLDSPIPDNSEVALFPPVTGG